MRRPCENRLVYMQRLWSSWVLMVFMRAANCRSEIRVRGTWLALSVESETLDLRVASSNPMLAVEMNL